jgi:uncharacterized membrane protein (UPF0127 family)
VALACLLLGLLAPSGASLALSSGTLVLETASGPHSFTIEIASTEADKTRGLMFRRSLPKNGGMLFLYEEPRPIAMWMKNTFIPLDMVFIDSSGRVHRIEAHTEPFSTQPISSEGEVRAILELNAGTAEAIGLKPGDRVKFEGLRGQ